MERSSVIALLLAAAFAAYVLWTARARRTTERHTFAWLLIAALIAALSIWRSAIDAVASAMGIYYAPSALFFVAGGGLVWLVYRQSLEIAELRSRVQRLAQEIAVLSALSDRHETNAQTEADSRRDER